MQNLEKSLAQIHGRFSMFSLLNYLLNYFDSLIILLTLSTVLFAHNLFAWFSSFSTRKLISKKATVTSNLKKKTTTYCCKFSNFSRTKILHPSQTHHHKFTVIFYHGSPLFPNTQLPQCCLLASLLNPMLLKSPLHFHSVPGTGVE